MKRIIALIITFAVCFTFTACSNDNESTDPKDLKPVESFGNNTNRASNDFSYISENYWVYTTGYYNKYSTSVISFPLDSPDKIKLKHSMTTSDESWLSDVSAFDGWVYFTWNYHTGPSNLYRVDEDGKGLSRLVRTSSDEGIPYVITNQGICYQQGSRIYVMDYNGGHNRQVVNTDEGTLEGVDNGWIYYRTDSRGIGYGYLYRIRSDGADLEQVLDLTDVAEYVVDNNQIYYTLWEDIEAVGNIWDTKKTLYNKIINGQETILGKGLGRFFYCLNASENWLYFAEKNKVYKINVTDEGEKQLIYSFPKVDKKGEPVYVDSILVYGGDILIFGYSKIVRIKEDGTKIELPSTSEGW